MTQSEVICQNCLSNMFNHLSYIYFVTIKPPPDRVDRILPLTGYLESKSHIDSYWIVHCMSPTGYHHYHGIVAFKESQTIDNKHLKALHKWINRNMGFLKIDPLATSIGKLYRYIRADHNNNGGLHTQIDYCNKATSHCGQLISVT